MVPKFHGRKACGFKRLNCEENQASHISSIQIPIDEHFTSPKQWMAINTDDHGGWTLEPYKIAILKHHTQPNPQKQESSMANAIDVPMHGKNPLCS